MMRYTLPDFRNTEEFLTLLAQKRGMLKKGGVPDMENVAKLLLSDWTGYACYEFCFMLLTFFHFVNPAPQKLSYILLWWRAGLANKCRARCPWISKDTWKESKHYHVLLHSLFADFCHTSVRGICLPLKCWVHVVLFCVQESIWQTFCGNLEWILYSESGNKCNSRSIIECDCYPCSSGSAAFTAPDFTGIWFVVTKYAISLSSLVWPIQLNTVTDNFRVKFK